MLWERHWKRQLKTLSDTYATDADRPDFTVKQLAGEGDLQKPSDQANTLPKAALQILAIAAKTSLCLTPDYSIPTQDFSNIKQGVDETIIKFVDRIKDALEKQRTQRQEKNCCASLP